MPNYSTNNASAWYVSKEASAALAVKMIVCQDLSSLRFLWSHSLDTALEVKKPTYKEAASKCASSRNLSSPSAATF